MTKENIQEQNPVEVDSTPTETQTVPLEMYTKLYQQAVELESRYKKLFVLYNNLLETYLAQK